MADLLSIVGATAVTTAIGTVIGVAVNRNSIASLARRVALLEAFDASLPEKYMPRLELDRALKSLDRYAEQTNTLVRQLSYGRSGDRSTLAAIEAAALHFVYDHAGLMLTESMEGCELKAYWDKFASCWTIGYGHTGPDVHEGLIITLAQADILLAGDILAAAACVNASVIYPISQAQFDACVDFTFNTGRGAFLRSTLLKLINAGQLRAAAEQFLLWVNSGGQRVNGLVRRRTAERALFLHEAA